MKKIYFALSILAVVGLLSLMGLRDQNLVAAQSSGCAAMSYNTPIIVSGSATRSYRLSGTLSQQQVLASATGQGVAQSALSQCMEQAATAFGTEAQNCMDICSVASTPREICTGTAQLHGSCPPPTCTASVRHTSSNLHYGETDDWTSGKIQCQTTGRFTVACVCSGNLI